MSNAMNGHLNRRLRVCVIGAGAAGLVNARLLKDRSDVFDITVYETLDQIGGIWIYNEESGFDQEGKRIKASMYRNLRTNLPLCIMQFSDFDARSSNAGRFVSHEEVLCYLQQYADHYNLLPLIRFRHEVTQVKRTQDTWHTTVKDLTTAVTHEKEFDAVLVCNGRYSKPYIPVIKDMDKFTGDIIHVHDYRHATPFTGKRIVVLGAGPSGIDISLELASCADAVHLCHTGKQMLSNLPDNMREYNCSIDSFDGSSVRLKSGQVLNNIDTLFLATGYHFDFDFLHESCGIRLSEEADSRINDLYLHLINIHHPSMAIWGVIKRILPFPIYEQQAKLFMRVLLGDVALPSQEEMMQDTEQEHASRLSAGIPSRHAHLMVDSQMLWSYEERLAVIAQIKRVKVSVRKVFSCLPMLRQSYPNVYKDFDFDILNEEEFVLSSNHRRLDFVNE